MKQLHKPNLYCWSQFNPDRNLDFHGYLWVREAGNILFDPVIMSEHDLAELDALGGAATILVSNSDHIRDSERLAKLTGAKIFGPKGESNTFPIQVSHWLGSANLTFDGLQTIELQGSKTPGELAFLIEGHTLITGDLIRCHQAGQLDLLPDSKLSNKDLAIQSLAELAQYNTIEAVLVGDGWPVFRDGHQYIVDLLTRVT